MRFRIVVVVVVCRTAFLIRFIGASTPFDRSRVGCLQLRVMVGKR